MKKLFQYIFPLCILLLTGNGHLSANTNTHSRAVARFSVDISFQRNTAHRSFVLPLWYMESEKEEEEESHSSRRYFSGGKFSPNIQSALIHGYLHPSITRCFPLLTPFSEYPDRYILFRVLRL